MIDFSAIEHELYTAVSSITTFKSIKEGRIRETVPITQMPSIDISAQGHTTSHDCQRHYDVPVLMVIRTKGFDRDDNVAAFKTLVEDVCAALEVYKGTSFARVRDIKSELGEEEAGNGAYSRVVAISMTAKSD